MIILDIAIIIIIIFSAFKGLKNGLIVEIGSLLALIAGYFLTTKFAHLIFNLLEGKDFVCSEYLPIIAYIITFIIIVVLVAIFAKILTRVAKIVKINWLNKLLGFIFGFCKAILIIGGLFIFVKYLSEKMDFSIELQKSYFFNPIVSFMKNLFSSLPF
ncbi:MAG: CvpA family protein [Bacteroidales bacterium]|jgi:membrane protein required for colicin V production|nr:CvpA family protein [Bacteroidales bacterium]